MSFRFHDLVRRRSLHGAALFAIVVLAVGLVAACSSSSSGGGAGGGGIASCSTPGAAVVGAADVHCKGQTPVKTNTASCMPSGSSGGGDTTDSGSGEGGASDDGGGGTTTCEYGDTMPNQEGDDDDCKYHVKWTSTPICEGSGGVTFTVTVTNLVDGSPATAGPMGVIIETFQPSSPTQSCDDVSTHPGPNTGASLTEKTAGSGVFEGPVVFDAPGAWTVRFHIHEECEDTLDDSPHGHAAFRMNVP